MPKQNRELKNRVREIRSHGSVRGMGCESHLYSEGHARHTCPTDSLTTDYPGFAEGSAEASTAPPAIRQPTDSTAGRWHG